jgi:hypothetical protein
MRVAILGDPTPEETAAIVATFARLFGRAAEGSTPPAPSTWRAAARSFDDAPDPWA